MFDPFEYLVLRDRDGLLKKDFKRRARQGQLPHPVPLRACRTSARRRARCSSGCPTPTVNTVERCAGHDGTWGVKTEFFAMSMKIGTAGVPADGAPQPDYVSSDCPIAGPPDRAGHRRGGRSHGPTKEHPLTLLRIAYGLD